MKPQAAAPQFPVMPLTLTLMWFSLDRLAWGTGWVVWHYKCLFIKLSPRAILLGSCVFVHFFPLCFFSLPPSRSHQIAHFSETQDKMSLFLPHFYVTVLCQQEETFIDFVSGCTEVRAAAAPVALTDLQPWLLLIQNPQLKTFLPVLSARFNKLSRLHSHQGCTVKSV